MPKIRFTQDAIFESDGRNKGRRFRRDQEIDCSEDVALRWERRGVAERVQPRKPSQPKPEPEKPVEELKPEPTKK